MQSGDFKLKTNIIMETRQLNLTHDEIDLISRALQYAYGKRLDVIKESTYMFGKKTTDAMLEIASEYEDLRASIDNSEKDV